MAKKAASQKNPAKEKNVSDEKILTKKIAQEKDADFSGFTSIEDAAVESLAKHNSGVCLNGLTSLSDAAAESLAKYQSGFLELNGLTSLSDAAVESLAKHKGGFLELNGLTSLSDAAAKSLAKHNRDLCLNGLTSLSDAAAAALSMHSRNIELEGITKLSDNAAKALAAHKQGLKLTALETLSDNALVLFKSRRFTLSHDLRKSMPAARTRIRESDKTKPKKKSSSLAAVLSKADVKKLRSLLQQKTAESVTLGLQLMKSLGVGDAVFTAPIRHQVGKVAHDWLRGGERTRADYELYHDCAIRPFWDSLRATTGKFIDLVNIMPGTGTIGETVVRPDSKQRIMHKFNKLIMGSQAPAPTPTISPACQLSVAKPYAIGRTVVTQGQWNAVMGTEPWRGKLRSDQQGVKYPAVYVTGPDAERFCEYLTRLERGQRHIQEDQEFRLPTGSQWEYACRAMSPTRYSFGDDSGQLDDYGWFNRNSGRRLHEVAQKQPNAWGLFDMHGNVQEWCADNDSGPHFDKLTYTSALASNDSDWTFASCYGGYWNSAAIACCCSSTCDFHADYWRNALKGIGFRVVLISCGAHLMRAKKPVKKTRALQATLKKKSAPTQPAKAVALTAAKAEHALSVSEREKIKKLLRTKTLEPVSLGLTLLESTAATPADWEAIFTPQIFTSLLISWVPEIWELVAKSLESYPELSTSFQTLALERCRKCPSKHAGFDGLLLARKAVCRPAFVKRWSASEHPGAFMDFISIPAGSFTMGSPKTEKDRYDNENQVPVTITRAFELGKTVVTQKQWTEVMGTDPWNWKNLKETGDNYPAVYISWLDASLFCEHLTSYEREAGRLSANQTYRLPTEAEWEYACRAGTTTAYSFGDDESKLGDYAWNRDNSSDRDIGELHEVATKNPNPWGLFDMHGNVSEWCSDWHDKKLSGGNDPKGPSAGMHGSGGQTGSYRVCRGGNWGYNVASDCRSAYRDSDDSGHPHDVGFRIVRVLL